MDKKHDQDERLIIDALNRVQTPNFDISKGVEAKMKKRFIGKKGFIATLLVACLFFTTVAVAQYTDSFERLAGIIGQERAETLTPIGITTADEGQSVQYDGIKAEVVAVNVTGNVVDLYVTLKDTVSNRLDGSDFILEHYLRPIGLNLDQDMDAARKIMGGSFGRLETIHRDGNGKITLHAQHNFGQSVEGKQLLFHLDQMWSIILDEGNRIADINLADFATNASTMPLQDRQVLTPQGLNIPLGLDGKYTVISSIGVVDGQLHVQTYSPDLGSRRWYVDGTSSPMLFRGSMEEFKNYMSSGDWLNDFPWEKRVIGESIAFFDIASDGSLVDGGQWHTYGELIFDIDIANIHEYTLIYNAFYIDVLRWEWEVTIDADSV